MSSKLRIARVSFLAFFLLVAAPATARAQWVRVHRFLHEPNAVDLSDRYGRYWSKHVLVENDCMTTSGAGDAFATSPYTSVTYTAQPAPGYLMVLWVHNGPGQGEVEVTSDAAIEGCARAGGPGEASAGVIGYSQADFWLDAVLYPATAAIDNVTSATSRLPGMPTLTLTSNSGHGSGLQVAIPIVWNDGGGSISGSALAHNFAIRCPVAQFRYVQSTQSKVHVWARGSRQGGRGVAECEIAGSNSISFNLLSHAHGCPR